MSENCKERVNRGRAQMSGCQRKAVKDGYCAQHHPENVKARRAAGQAAWEAEWAERERGWARKEARNAIADAVLAADPLTLPDAVREAREALVALTSTAIEGM